MRMHFGRSLSGLLGLFTVVLVCSSCENFLKGTETKKQLEERIAYANAPSYTIHVTSDKNRGVIKNPAGGEAQKKITDVFPVEFDASADYEFIKWKIIDSESKTEYKNGEYLLLDSIDSEYTSCTFVNAPQTGVKLTLYAVVEKRPRVISSSPQWTAEGAFRDARIQIMFDQDMNPDSIYFNTDEINEIKAEYELTDSDFYKNTDQKVYYYIADGLHYYKNISIVDYITGRSILNKYGEPYFEDPRTLVIPADGDGPDAGTQILVTISNEISSIRQNKKISLKDEATWIYYVNVNTDKEAPILNPASVIKNSNQNALPENSVTKLKKGQLYLDITVTDSGSGPAGYFTMNLESLDQTKTHSINIPYTTVTATTGTYKGIYSFPNYVDDGNYKITSLTYKDKNNKPGSKEFNYKIIKDTVPPLVSTVSLSQEDSSKLNYSYFGLDIHTVEIKKRLKGSTTAWETIENETYYASPASITDIDPDKTYEIMALFYDDADNTREILTTNGYINLKSSASIQKKLVTTENSIIHLNWDAPEGVNKYNLLVGEGEQHGYSKKYWTFDLSSDTSRYISKDDTSYDLTLKNVNLALSADNILKPAWAYVVRFRTYINNSSMQQEYYSSFKDILVCTPTANTSIDVTPTKIKVNWSIPSESPYRNTDSKMYLCFAETLEDLNSDSNTNKLELTISPDKDAQSQEFDLSSPSFTNFHGKKCYFAIKSIVKMTVGSSPSQVEVTTDPVWSKVVCADPLPQPVKPPLIKLKSDGKLHEKDISQDQVRLRFTPSSENWNRVDFYLNSEKKGSVSKTDAKKEFIFQGLDVNTQYTFSARTVYITDGVTYESDPVSISAKTGLPLGGLNFKQGATVGSFTWNSCTNVSIPSTYAGGSDNKKVERIQIRYILDDDSTDNSEWTYCGGKVGYSNQAFVNGFEPNQTSCTITGMSMGKSYVIKVETFCVYQYSFYSDPHLYQYTTNTYYISYQ